MGRESEALFWLLLPGSWQFLASPGRKSGIVGAIGTATFLLFAWANLDNLRRLGLDCARWRSVTGRNWLCAMVSGFIAGVTVFGIASASGQSMRLADDWRLVALQVTLGPVLEEAVFRGYLFALPMWSFSRVADAGRRNRLVVSIVAVVFALVHLAQPGVSWLQLACITSTGALYGWIRYRSGSTAAAAASHAAYNLKLYAITGVMRVLTGAPAGR